MVMFGERPIDRDEDAIKERKGRPFRDYAFVMSTGQNFDRVSWLDVVRDGHALVSVWFFLMFALLGVPGVITVLFMIYAAVRFGLRYLAMSPANREEGCRHVIVIFEASGFWHVAEYIRGKGEIVRVLTDQNGAIPAQIGAHIFDKVTRADWGDASSDETPRQIIRRVKTYRRRPRTRLPFAFYPKTSVGFAAHMLGIHDPRIRTPKDLLDYCERAGDDEKSEVLQAKAA
ncbi:MAG: hypothetical protein R3F54_28770 [Alphaproteobacteria bacterium]